MEPLLHGGKKGIILAILDIFKKYSDDDHPINAADIIEKLEEKEIKAERKSVYDSITLLQDYGYDIIKTTLPKRGWFLGERELELPEIYLLSDAVRSARFISARKTRELLKKLGGFLSEYDAAQTPERVYFAATEKSENEDIYYHIDSLYRAIKANRKVKIRYTRRTYGENRVIGSGTKEMTVNPYALCWQDDAYYLIGNHEKYNNLIHLRLDRITRVESTELPARPFKEVSEYRDFFDTADNVDKLFGMHSGEIVEVELVCHKSVTEPLLDRFGKDLFLYHITEDTFTVKVKAALSEGLVTWVMNYGEHIKVTKPEGLIQMVKDRAKTILESYENGENNENA